MGYDSVPIQVCHSHQATHKALSKMSSTGSISVPDEKEFTATDLAIIFGASLVMLVILYIFRYVLNVFVIDICILGDCSAWKRICGYCCCGSDDDDSGPPHWGTREAVALQNIGAFGNPKRFLYSEEMGEEHRKAFLAIILKHEVSMLHNYVLL